MDVEAQSKREWLETDGLGGFAMGTASTVRTRRYHGLLLVARHPPADRTMLVSGIEAWVERGGRRLELTTQRYAPNVLHPGGAHSIASFDHEPWPRWTYALPDGSRIEHEIFVPQGRGAVCLSWRANDPGTRLFVRPLLCARDFHSMQHENTALRPNPSIVRGRLCFRLYDGAPELVVAADADYVHEPQWFRRFAYAEEEARGLDAEEDLWSPGTFAWDLAQGAALVFTARGSDGGLADDPRPPREIVDALAASERARRAAFASPLARAADQYLVARGRGKTIIAGYPWFGDWGRDTFIALRGLCLAAGRLDDAGAILREWAGAVSEGMLPNRFPDHGGSPELNSVDAALWFVVAVGEYLALRRGNDGERALLLDAARAIVDGYRRGTRYRIHADSDGLVAAGEPGVQLTWMDARIGDRVITPRIGKPVEIQALWLNALAVVKARDADLEPLFARALESFRARFPDLERGTLADVVDVDHVAGRDDRSMRPNQILAVGGLPFAAIEGPLARRIVDAVERELWTPLGLRSLAPDDGRYTRSYTGGVESRDGCYHQGTVWPWLAGPFVDAWMRVRGGSAEAKTEARRRFLAPLEAHLAEAGLGHVSEIADADPPHTPRGCPFQAWSVGELLRIRAMLA